MNSRDLVLAALRGQSVSRVPVGPLAVHYCAKFAGVSLRDYTTNATCLADAVVRYYERFQPDAVWVSADTWVSAEAMGAMVAASGDDQPIGGVGPPKVQKSTDIDRIPSPNVERQGRYPLMLQALKRVVHQLDKEVCVVACFDQFPFSLAAALMGINEIMVKLCDDPPFVEALMARCSEYAQAYAVALADAGADILSGGDSPAGLVSPQTYERHILPAETALITAVKARTGKPVSLHICGDSSRILPLMKTTGADVLEIDHAVQLGEACRIVGPDVGLWGNLDPVSVLQQGTSKEVRHTARKAMEDAAEWGHNRFVLSSGCTLAVQTPDANLEALIATPRINSTTP